jgi:hypothetical protein
MNIVLELSRMVKMKKMVDYIHWQQSKHNQQYQK